MLYQVKNFFITPAVCILAFSCYMITLPHEPYSALFMCAIIGRWYWYNIRQYTCAVTDFCGTGTSERRFPPQKQPHTINEVFFLHLCGRIHSLRHFSGGVQHTHIWDQLMISYLCIYHFHMTHLKISIVQSLWANAQCSCYGECLVIIFGCFFASHFRRLCSPKNRWIVAIDTWGRCK